MAIEFPERELIRGIDLLTTQPRMSPVDFPTGTLVVKMGETRVGVGALRLFQNADSSIILFNVYGVLNPVQVAFERADLTAEEINQAGNIAYGLFNIQKQINVAENVGESHESMIAQRTTLVQEADTLGITFIQNPSDYDFINVKLSIQLNQPDTAVQTDQTFTDTELEKLYQQLGIKPDDQLMEKINPIYRMFSRLRLFSPRPSEGVVFEKSPGSSGFRFDYDYFFGQYKFKGSEPRSVHANARTALLDGVEGVPENEILKSIALKTSDGQLVFMHLRADRDIDPEVIAREGLIMADITKLGLEYGTVNPFVTADIPIRHIFDTDLIGGPDHPGTKRVLASSGDTRFYVAFNINDFIEAYTQKSAEEATYPISKAGPERIIARRDAIIMGGDSPKNTFELGIDISEAATRILGEADQFFGDRSMPNIFPFTDRELAGSIDTRLNGNRLLDLVAYHILPRLQQLSKKKRPVVAFSSTAMDGLAGDRMRQDEHIDYVGRQEAVERILTQLAELGITISNTLLLTLPSGYDRELSAFGGDILDKVLPIDPKTQGQIEKFVQKCKEGPVSEKDAMDFYNNIPGKVLRNRARRDRTTIEDETFVAVAGVSELETFIKESKVPQNFIKHIYTNAEALAEELAKPTDGKTRLIFILPSKAFAEEIARKTLEPV